MPSIPEMKKISEARTFGSLRIYPNPMRSDGVFLGEDKEIKPYEGVRGLDGPLYPAVPQDAWMLPSQIERENAQFIAMAANNFDKLLAIVEAARETEKLFMAIDDGFFTGLVPPEFFGVSKALKALKLDPTAWDKSLEEILKGLHKE